MDRQPNGVYNEKCTSINFFSIYSMNDWHDTACAYDKIRSYMCEIDINYTKGAHCTDAQFRCGDGGCISLSLLCDFVAHCVDGSDESSCIRQPCNESQWECSSGQCIPAVYRCDMKPDCVDGSDEQFCGIVMRIEHFDWLVTSCKSYMREAAAQFGQIAPPIISALIESCEYGFECYDQTCIHRSKVCDGFIDCNGFFAEDESQSCENNVRKSCKDWWSLGRRENGEYLVSLGLGGKCSHNI
uniref:Very low-density lipoprotein receptor n=1 Tax=Magallana gigas TaxID=29159 RepID=K1QA48_MAGGI